MYYMWQNIARLCRTLWLYRSGTTNLSCRPLQIYHPDFTNDLQGDNVVQLFAKIYRTIASYINQLCYLYRIVLIFY